MSEPVSQSSDVIREKAHGAHERKPNLNSSDPYAVLGLPRRAPAREVKRAYFDLVRQYPPETQGEAFKLIRTAYEKLQNAETKAETDLFLFHSPPPWQPRKRLPKLDLTFDAQDFWALLQFQGDLAMPDFKADYRPLKP